MTRIIRSKRYVLKCLLLTCLICMLLSCSASQTDTVVSLRNIKIAFDYYNLTQNDITYLSNFEIVVTGDFAPQEAVRALKARGTKLIFYDWLVGFYYCSDPTEWEQTVYQNRSTWTLNPLDTDPHPRKDKTGCPDYYYDVANDDLINARVDYLVRVVTANGYDGVFFDWAAGWNDLIKNGYTFLTTEFQRRHPGIDYDDKVNQFFKKLKDSGLMIITNTAFESVQSKLVRYSNIDIQESTFTTDDCKNVFYQIYIDGEGVKSVCDSKFNSTEVSVNYSTSIISQARSVNSAIYFLFLNYAFPYYRDTGRTIQVGGITYKVYEKIPDRQAIFYSLANSYLVNASGFTNGPNVSLDFVKDDVFFTDMGFPEGDMQRLSAGVYLRYYTRGFAVTSDNDVTLQVSVPQSATGLLDLYSNNTIAVSSGRATLNLMSQVYPSGNRHPIGRIYIYQ